VLLVGAGLLASGALPAAAKDGAAAAAPITTITEMEPAFAKARAAAAAHGASRVLLVFDLDSTLLRNSRQEPDIAGLRDSDPDQFRAVERAIMYLSRLVPMEPDLAARVAAVQASGVDVLILTARGADMRDMTLRELAANGFGTFRAPECGPPLCRKRGIVPAADVLAAARRAMGAAALTALGFDRGRDITVADGVVTAAGLDKGVLLRTLLSSFPRRYTTLIFVDDAQKNVDHAARAAPGARETFAIFHYRGPARPVADDPRDKATVTADWQAATAAICRALGPRWCDADAP
jgi:hypothetical protein